MADNLEEELMPEMNEEPVTKYLLRDIESLKANVETLQDALGNINMRILENKEHVAALDKRMSIFVPRRTNDNG